MLIRDGEILMNFDNDNSNLIKEAIKHKIKEKIKKELLEEIYTELKSEEELIDEMTSEFNKKNPSENTKKINITHEGAPKDSKITYIKPNDTEAKIVITVKAILKIASHSLKYAHSKIPREDWVEVIGLLAGKLDNSGHILHIEDAYPMGHGTAVYAEIKDYRNYVRAFKDIKRNKLFICGWYHSHPSYGCFMSNEDIGTQARYQKLWDKAIALVIDPYQIDGTSLGFEIYRANIRTKKWFSIPYNIKGHLDVRMLPEILAFMNPIIEGKPIYLEYDED
jgi:proteasome lid subunit RPN8/RPN11